MTFNMYYRAREVFPRIWIGSMADAASTEFMRAHNIGLIINCTKDVPSSFAATIPTYRIPLDDIESSSSTLYQYAPTISREMWNHLDRTDTSILVHCAAGISRSASMVASYLIIEYGYNMRNAIQFIRQRKPETFQPRLVFSSALALLHQNRMQNL